MIKVNKNMCDQCLFSPNKIVSEKRMSTIVQGCIRDQTHFICHKTKDVVCGGFDKTMGDYSQMLRIAERLKTIELIDN